MMRGKTEHENVWNKHFDSIGIHLDLYQHQPDDLYNFQNTECPWTTFFNFKYGYWRYTASNVHIK